MAQPRKRFGQHWLRSEKVLHQILTAAELTGSDRVLEIGPGTGILTRWLLPLVESVVAIEIDRDLCKRLVQTFREAQNFLLLQGDVLELDWDAQLQSFEKFQSPNKVVANIPYYITGPILERLLGTITNPNPDPFKTIVLLVQKEVAERICAKPGNKSFGALSVRVQYLAQADFMCTVPAKAFQPPPKVDSAVVRLTPRSFPTPVHNPRQMESLVKIGFATKRKMLRNNLKGMLDRDRSLDLFEKLDISPQARAEDVSVAQWVSLSNMLSNVTDNAAKKLHSSVSGHDINESNPDSVPQNELEMEE
ncbi:MAG: 16S rRNA (adenine(1518)-N(6)/adenine(1519)-N(6))-dimethyltransferase RsmA [Thainema sp.]